MAGFNKDAANKDLDTLLAEGNDDGSTGGAAEGGATGGSDAGASVAGGGVTPPATATPQTPTEYFELMHEGKQLKIPLQTELIINENGQVQRVPANKMVNNHRQVSHLMGIQKKFKDEKTQWETQNKDWENLSKHYREIDDWARKNPNDWQKVQQAYAQRESLMQGGTPAAGGGTAPAQYSLPPEVTKTINDLQERLGKYENMYSSFEKDKDTKEVNGEIDDFKKQFPALNLDELDEDSISLKGRILHFAAENGYKTFRSAALDFPASDGKPLLTKLIETATEAGRNAAVKGVKQDTKNGVIARSNTPFTGQGTSKRNLTEADRKDAMIQDFEALYPEGS